MRPSFMQRGAGCFASISAGIALAVTVFTGCRVNDDDIRRWENTAHGPEKLRAVLLHDKYETPLRVEAALALVHMKPRAGRRIGVGAMVDTLAGLSPETRQVIVRDLVPAVVAELKKPPPVPQAGQAAPPDGSFAFKDAAFAMLAHEGTVIISDEALKQNIKTVLVEWAMADFEHRLENRTQAYGMEQLLRFIGPPAVVGIPKLMTRDAKRVDQMASLVAEIGDDRTKTAASQALVGIANYVLSDDWLKNKRPELSAANAAQKLEPTEKQFQAQLAKYQDEELVRVFASMRKVGGRPAVEFALDFASKKEQSEGRRQAALASLEGRLDKNNPEDIKRILQIASSDAPDVVLDQAFRRVGDMPREQVVAKLYELFGTEKWKVGRAAGVTVLKMSTVKHVDEFLGKLPDGAKAKGFAMGEAITFGAYLGELKEGKPLDALKPHFTTGGGAARATALSYYLQFGTKDDIPAVEAFQGDKTRVPVCETDPDCKWSCEVAKEGAADPTKDREMKDIKTVGEFVKFCIVPAMRERQPEAKK